MYIWYGDWLAKALTGATPIAADKCCYSHRASTPTAV